MTTIAAFNRAKSFLKRAIASIDGVAAVEFGLLSPVLLTMLLGSIEASRAINIDRRFGMVTTTIGDLVAREKQIGTNSTEAKAELDGMMEAVQQVMQPYDPAPPAASGLKIRVFSVKASSTNANDTKVEWSYTPTRHSYSAPAKCSAHTLTSGLVSAGGSVIVVESQFTYRPLFTTWLSNSFRGTVVWNDKSINSPRNSCVDYAGTNCVLTCP